MIASRSVQHGPIDMALVGHFVFHPWGELYNRNKSSMYVNTRNMLYKWLEGSRRKIGSTTFPEVLITNGSS